MALSEALAGLENMFGENNKTPFGELCWFGVIFCDRLTPTIGDDADHIGAIVQKDVDHNLSKINFHYLENEDPFLSIVMGQEFDLLQNEEVIDPALWTNAIHDEEKKDPRSGLALNAVAETITDEFFDIVLITENQLKIRSEHGVIFTLHWDSMAFCQPPTDGADDETFY